MWLTRWTGLLLIAGLFVGAARSSEKLNRGVVADVNSEGNVYVGWRLLKEDPKDVSFNVYRQTEQKQAVKVNAKPLTDSTNIVDTAAPRRHENAWFVRALVQGREQKPSEMANYLPTHRQIKSGLLNYRATTPLTKSPSQISMAMECTTT